MSGTRHRKAPEERVSHGRNAWRDFGKPRKYVTDSRCKSKPRYSDQPEAMAAALVSLENPGQRAPRNELWVYRCSHCFGWHLTSKNKGPRFRVELRREVAA